MIYNREKYLKDLDNPEMNHIKNREHFRNFYEELSNDPDQTSNQYYINERMFFIEPKGKILELGCHWGFNMIHYAKLGFECVGVELSQGLINIGLEKLKLEPKEISNKITLIQGFIEDFNTSEKFDTIILTEVLEHVMDPFPVLKKAVECLSEDGILYISVPSKRFGTYSHVRGIDNDELVELFRKISGIVKIKFINNVIQNVNGKDIRITTAIAYKK